MVRRPVPVLEVVSGSTPVVSFGALHGARVATLGINPSKAEFTDGATLLSGGDRRLATLESLGAKATEDLSDAQVAQVVRDCEQYFKANPYWRWFRPLEGLLLEATGTSYSAGTACHLDLVQWATDPIWGRLTNKRTRKKLLEEGLPFLKAQLQTARLDVVVLNGISVVNEVQRNIVPLAQVDAINFAGSTCRLFANDAAGVKYIGWSTNLQSSHGVSLEFRERLADSVRQQLKGIRYVERPERLTEREFIPKGTRVEGPGGLAALLRNWYAQSDALTIGEVTTFGGTACVYIEQRGVSIAVLNADTKRTAVRDYLHNVNRVGADACWHLVPSKRGRRKRVLFDPEVPTSGWYCYAAER